ncbi:MAG TPA: hypothetical protein VEY91_01490 [Candidatus Limnocylindria bacterium]|nr:hypothetical protein [Candidatus Limnocylindria bacterium]
MASSIAISSEAEEAPSRLAPWLLFLGSVLVYLLFPTRNFNYADDSLGWANGITRSDGLISSHHLFFNGLKVTYSALGRIAGDGLDPTRFLATYSALCGALGLVILYRLLVLARCGRAAILGALLAGTTMGYWSYSIVGDAYIPATMFLLAGIYGVASGLASPHPVAPWRVLATALAFVLMMLHHQGFFLTVLGLVPGVLFSHGAARSARIRYGFVVPLVAGLSTLLIYLAVHGAQPASKRGTFLDFASGQAASFAKIPDMKNVSFKSVVNGCAGVTRAALSTNFLFKSRGFADALQSRFPYRNVYPYPYLVRRLPWPLVIVLGACFMTSLALLTVLVIRGIFAAVRTREAAWVALMTAVPQAVFALWWEAVSDEFWIWSTPFLALFATAGAVSYARTGRRLLGILLVGVALSSVVSIWLYLDPTNDIDRVNDEYLEQLGSTDLLISLNDIVQDNRMRLAQQRQGFERVELAAPAMLQHTIPMEPLERALSRTIERGGAVYVDPYVARPPKSLVQKLTISAPRFEPERHAVLARLRLVDRSRIRWMPLQAEVAGYFEESPLVNHAGQPGDSGP